MFKSLIKDEHFLLKMELPSGLFFILFCKYFNRRKLMLVHSTLDNLENGEGHEHVHEVELVPRSDLPYRYMSNMFFLKEKYLHPVAASLLLLPKAKSLSTGNLTIR